LSNSLAMTGDFLKMLHCIST